jgi:5-methylcytosine-specific restriction endonuclease McrA
VLAIIATDSTFYVGFTDPLIYVGKCIHCNSMVTATMQGSTNATIEHIRPLCNGGDPVDPRNLALACTGCNNEKGIRHDRHAGKGGRADEVIAALQAKRAARWQEPRMQIQPLTWYS